MLQFLVEQIAILLELVDIIARLLHLPEILLLYFASIHFLVVLVLLLFDGLDALDLFLQLQDPVLEEDRVELRLFVGFNQGLED